MCWNKIFIILILTLESAPFWFILWHFITVTCGSRVVEGPEKRKHQHYVSRWKMEKGGVWVMDLTVNNKPWWYNSINQLDNIYWANWPWLLIIFYLSKIKIYICSLLRVGLKRTHRNTLSMYEGTIYQMCGGNRDSLFFLELTYY